MRINRDPNPLRVGCVAGGPPRSVQHRSRMSVSPSRRTTQSTATRPAGAVSAPYLAAFVASSCSISDSDSVALGPMITSGPDSRNRSSPNVASAPIATSPNLAVDHWSRVSTSFAAASADSRLPKAVTAS
ncbi:hypothetical protein WR25_11181 [Diploscapter pachys]|uniref:Uncharacterized protein n=1 Tax=Diploscapter pachys TaxID=2018661 RepID=A0A2A2JYH9_9BILA|nr:hypothetical protein WR25_11181 [Diploscapter pachys]